MFMRLAKAGVYVLFVLLCVIGGSIGSVLLDSWRRHEVYLGREAEFQAQLANLHQELALKEQYYAQLQSDPVFLEQIVKEKLGYVRPDETVFRFENKKNSSGPVD